MTYIDLIRKVTAKGIEFPETIDMEKWGELVEEDREHPCDSVGCFLGTAVFIATPELFRSLVSSMAGQKRWELEGSVALDLTFDQAGRVAYLDRWPLLFAQPTIRAALERGDQRRRQEGLGLPHHFWVAAAIVAAIGFALWFIFTAA